MAAAATTSYDAVTYLLDRANILDTVMKQVRGRHATKSPDASGSSVSPTARPRVFTKMPHHYSPAYPSVCQVKVP